MKVESHLLFDGRCQEAMEFYQSALGAKLEFLMPASRTAYARQSQPNVPSVMSA